MDVDEEYPDYLNILSPADMEQYKIMRRCFSARAWKSDSFKDVLNQIKHYSIRNNDDDYKRCDCCGVCWLPDKIGVNTMRLSYLTGQQKNNINSALSKLNYVPAAFTEELFSFIPTLQGNTPEIRKWSIRKLHITQTPSPSVHAFVKKKTVTMFSSPEASFSVFSERRWSYEQYNLKESDNDGFLEDSFSIPLKDWDSGI